VEAELLVELAQRSLDRRLAGIAASAGQGPLTAMGAQMRCAQREQQCRVIALAGRGERNCHRGTLQRRRRLVLRQSREGRAGGRDIPPCGIVERSHDA
jgi:hypothetical protein